MSFAPGWAIGLLVAFVALATVSVLAARRRTGRTLPSVLAVLAGFIAVLLVVVIVGVLALNQ